MFCLFPSHLTLLDTPIKPPSSASPPHCSQSTATLTIFTHFFICPITHVLFASLRRSGHFHSGCCSNESEIKSKYLSVCRSACDALASICRDLLHKAQRANKGWSRKIRGRSRWEKIKEKKKKALLLSPPTHVCMFSTLITCVSVWGSLSALHTFTYSLIPALTPTLSLCLSLPPSPLLSLLQLDSGTCAPSFSHFLLSFLLLLLLSLSTIL